MALAETPDLILLDVMMPEMDGFEVCQRLKADRRRRTSPSSSSRPSIEEGEETRGLELGAIDFISKPISPPVVKARVRNHIELKRQRDILGGLSFLDGLTGLANRRRFDQFLDMEWRRGIRSGAPLSLDHDGHRLLRALQRCGRPPRRGRLPAQGRPGSRRGRPEAWGPRGTVGGEEFGCVLSETATASARIVAERLQAAVAELALPHPRSTVSPWVTLSMGVATVIPTFGAESRALMQAADLAMYAAKAAGAEAACSVQATDLFTTPLGRPWRTRGRCRG